MSIIDLIPPSYQLPAFILFAIFPWAIVATVALKAWRISVRKAHAQLAYRALEERCRAIVDLASSAWPEIRDLRGEEYINALESKLRAIRFLFDSIEDVTKLDIPPAFRWYIRQVQSIKHHLREHDYPDDGNPAGMVLLALGNPAPSMERIVRQVHERNEAIHKEFKRVIEVCAGYAPGMTFADSLSHYVSACLEDVRSYVGKPKEGI